VYGFAYNVRQDGLERGRPLAWGVGSEHKPLPTADCPSITSPAGGEKAAISHP